MSILHNSRDIPKRRAITHRERRTLEQFACMEISVEDLQICLGKMLEIDFQAHERRLTSHFLFPQPGVRVEKKFIQTAMEKYARGEISTEHFAAWATILLMHDAYDLQGPDEEEIAERLNEISILTLKAKPGTND